MLEPDVVGSRSLWVIVTMSESVPEELAGSRKLKVMFRVMVLVVQIFRGNSTARSRLSPMIGRRLPAPDRRCSEYWTSEDQIDRVVQIE
ncbi:MAG: hypothetical protein ACLR8Y_15870 [Alistipes indistinctus]